jgi:hypothetical protein
MINPDTAIRPLVCIYEANDGSHKAHELRVKCEEIITTYNAYEI